MGESQKKNAEVLDMEVCHGLREAMIKRLSIIEEKEEASGDSYYL